MMEFTYQMVEATSRPLVVKGKHATLTLRSTFTEDPKKLRLYMKDEPWVAAVWEARVFVCRIEVTQMKWDTGDKVHDLWTVLVEAPGSPTLHTEAGEITSRDQAIKVLTEMLDGDMRAARPI